MQTGSAILNHADAPLGIIRSTLEKGDTTMTGQTTQVLRTPDSSFEGLDGFAYEPRYLEVDGLRIHYVDEGPADAAPVLLVHGWPAWGYQWRTVIPALLAAG